MQRNNKDQSRLLSTENNRIRRKNIINLNKKKKKIDEIFIRKELNFLKNFLPGSMHF